jgi:hypothetical protein
VFVDLGFAAPLLPCAGDAGSASVSGIPCSGGRCDRRMVDVRLDTLPQDLPWSEIGRRLARNVALQARRTSCRTGMTEKAKPRHSPNNGKRET